MKVFRRKSRWPTEIDKVNELIAKAWGACRHSRSSRACVAEPHLTGPSDRRGALEGSLQPGRTAGAEPRLCGAVPQARRAVCEGDARSLDAGAGRAGRLPAEGADHRARLRGRAGAVGQRYHRAAGLCICRSASSAAITCIMAKGNATLNLPVLDGDRLSDRADDAWHPPDDRRGICRARCAAVLCAARPGRADGARRSFRWASGWIPSRGSAVALHAGHGAGDGAGAAPQGAVVLLRPCPSRADAGGSAGRFMAEMITGETTFCDPAPYRADRF
jgi:hypothetical protein